MFREDFPVLMDPELAGPGIGSITGLLRGAPPGSMSYDRKSDRVIARCADQDCSEPTFIALRRLKDARSSGKGWLSAKDWWNGKVIHRQPQSNLLLTR